MYIIITWITEEANNAVKNTYYLVILISIFTN